MNIQRALRFLRPGVNYLFQGYEEYDYLIWPEGILKPTLEELKEADLPAAKAERVFRAKREAALRIYAKYPAYAQSNAALGLYNNLPPSDPFYVDNIKKGIQDIVDAERAAEVAIYALQDVESVESFTW